MYWQPGEAFHAKQRSLVQAEVGRARLGVFLCGPLPVQRLVSKACARLSQSGDATFVFHAEHF